VTKVIKVQSNLKKIKNYLDKNIFFRIIRLLINPLNLVNKIKNYKNKKKEIIKINWSLRAKKFGKYSVIDTQTPKEEFNYVTNIQKKILFGNLKKYLNGNEKNALDFGCGTGRFSNELIKLNNKILVLAVDAEKKLIDVADRKNRIKYLYLRKLDQISINFDIIFISNVLGGIEKKELRKVSEFLISKLNKGGIFYLSEHISKKKIKNTEILKEWSNRNDNYYINLFKKVSLRKIDEYQYLHNKTSIYIGKKK